jgi:voltage-gated potassium channel Kch
MRLGQPSQTARRSITVLRAAVVLLALASAVLGYLGLADFVAGHKDFGDRALDVIYYDLQLFALGSDPLQDQGPYPVALEIARFTAPATSLYALFETGRLLFAAEVRRWRVRRVRDHVIVCGDSCLAEALARRLQASPADVVEIRSRSDETAVEDAPLRIVGDPRDPRVLRAAGIDTAKAVYACADGNAMNAAVALAAGRARTQTGRPLPVYSHIPDADLCTAFQAAYLERSDSGAVHLDFFNINHIAARRLFAHDPLSVVDGHAPRILVAGTDGLGAAVVLAAARSWRVASTRPERMPTALVGTRAGEILAGLGQRYPFLPKVCDLISLDTDLITLLTRGHLRFPADRIYICYEDEDTALTSAMAVERLWRGELHGVVVRLDSMAASPDEEPLSPVFPGWVSPFDRHDRRLRVFGVVGAACDPSLIEEDLVERLAQVIHERYRQSRRDHGDWAPGEPSLLPWDRLSPRLRQANRAQALDIGPKLAHVRCTLTPRLGADGDLVLSPSDIEVLARREHERWSHEYARAGWHYSPLRSDERRQHPGLLPWTVLPDHFRRRTYDAVNELADVVADAGLRIVRR